MKIILIIALAVTAYSSDCVYYGTRISKTISQYDRAHTRDLIDEKFGLLHFYIHETKANCRSKSKYYKRAVEANIKYKRVK